MNIRSRISIFDTFTAQTTINKAQLTELVNFIIFNRGYKLNANEVKTLTGARSLTATVIGNLYSRAIELRKEAVFSFLKVPKLGVSIPEVLTYTHVTYDLKQLGDSAEGKDLYEVVSRIPDFANTICFNTTPLLRGTGEPIDALSFQSIFVRDLLSRSYFDNKSTMWLSPSLIRYLCRFYNMSLSSTIGTVYNLTFQEQLAVATVFSLFFLQKVSDTNSAEAFIKTQKLDLGSVQEITDIINRVKTALGDKYDSMTLDDACAGVNALGIGRLQSIGRKFLYTRLRSIGPDVFTSTMALEYPPYFTYLVLLTLSGRKMGLTSTLKRTTLQKDAPAFMDDIVKTYSFLPTL
jgi:hypothetical protein